MRKLIAKAMYASLQNSAQLTHHLSADARGILALRKKVKKAVDNGYPTNITLNDMVCMAVIRALKKFPQVNSHFLGDSVRLFSKVHLGLAVDTERGLMVPVVKNADDLSIQGLANQLKEVANACKKGSIDPDLLSSEAASFTVSNLGNYGVEIFTPVINLPQVAILGVNTIVPRPKDIGGGVYAFVPHIGLSLRSPCFGWRRGYPICKRDRQRNRSARLRLVTDRMVMGRSRYCASFPCILQHKH